MDFRSVERARADQGQDGGDRRNHVGGQRSNAFDRTAGQRGELRRISNGISEGIRNRDTDTGRSTPHEKEKKKQSEQKKRGESPKARAANRKMEEWSHPSDPQAEKWGG